MKTPVCFLFTFALLSGCAPSTPPVEPRHAITLEELAVTVRDTARSYMLSDKKGGFLVGTLDIPGRDLSIRWSIDGLEVLRGLTVSVGDNLLSPAQCDSAVVYPNEAEYFYSGGVTETVQLLDGFPDSLDGHALAVVVQSPAALGILFHAMPGQPSTEIPRTGQEITLRTGGGSITLYAGPEAVRTGHGLGLRKVAKATLLMVFSPSGESGRKVADVFTRVDALRSARASRMERFLDDAYLWTSDPQLNKAVSWTKLLLDDMVLERQDTIIAGGVPWDGSIDGRGTAQAIPGLTLATSNYSDVAGILRSLARWQDHESSRSTFGRIADRVRHGAATYNGADVGPWFFREMFEYVNFANDTLLVKSLYPEIKAGIEGTLRFHTDKYNLLTHGDGETWMNAVAGGKAFAPRGNRAAEIQLLWYFQQLIGSYVATYLGDGELARQWSALAKKTSAGFDAVFVDTARNLIYDHVSADGKGSTELRPNTILCLEIIGSELVQQTMIKNVIDHLVYRQGVGTLDQHDKRFRPYAGAAGSGAAEEAMYNGPIWSWLTGQLTYTLTRYDRQDFGYTLTRRLVEQALERDMVGAIPSMLEAAPRPGMTTLRGAGEQASLRGMAEFVRSLYQDYIGLRIDAPSNMIELQPKLPPGLTDVDFTVYVGNVPVQGRFHRGKENSRIVIHASDLPRQMNFRFLWMMDNGDAWRGGTTLLSNTELTVVLGPEDLLAYQGDNKISLTGVRKLKKFSLQSSFTGFTFAEAPATR